MKKLSKWAKHNPTKSRIIIGISHILVGLNACLLGILLFLFDFGTFKWSAIIVANLFFISFLLYPKKEKRTKRFRCSYARLKINDFCLVIFYSVTIVLGVNNFLTIPNNEFATARQPSAEFVVFEINSENKKINRKKPRSEFKKKVKKLRKQIRQEFRALKKATKKSKNKKGILVLKILLTLLTTAVVISLGTLIASLACSIACSGYEGIAIGVLIVGWAALMWLGFITTKIIFEKIGRRNKTSSAPAKN